MHPSLRLAGLLNPLDSPHHMREDDDCPFREGVVVDRDVKKGAGSFVDIGKRKVGGDVGKWRAGGRGGCGSLSSACTLCGQLMYYRFMSFV